MIVIVLPALALFAHLAQAGEEVSVEKFAAKRAVKTFHVGDLSWTGGLNPVQVNLLAPAPGLPHLISLQDPINTTSPGGQLVFQIFCALAEHERNVLVQRTRAGLQAARARGRQGGRHPGLAPRYQKVATAVKELYEEGQQSTRQLMDYFQIGSRRMLYKILRFADCQINEKSALSAAKSVDKALP